LQFCCRLTARQRKSSSSLVDVQKHPLCGAVRTRSDGSELVRGGHGSVCEVAASPQFLCDASFICSFADEWALAQSRDQSAQSADRRPWNQIDKSLSQCPIAAVRRFHSRLGTRASSRLQQVRDSIVVSISACHAEDPGSIPGRGVSVHHSNEERKRFAGLQGAG
jgi:hypothetical protein